MPDETPDQSYAPFAGPKLDAFASQLKAQTAAVRLQYGKFGVSRSLAAGQINQAARVFSAAPDLVRASKKILNSRDPAWIAVTSPIGKARLYWRTMTVPYPVKGIRLIRRDQMEIFSQSMERFHAELEEGKQKLDEEYGTLKKTARERLGTLFDESDYPASITDDFTLDWDFPSVEPPDYLKTLNPALYEQERQRLENRFAEAAMLAENAFAVELQELVGHLVERMTPDEPNADGTAPKKKRLNKKALEGFKEFFDRLQSIRVGSNSQLDQVVASARSLVENASLDELRSNETMRTNMANQMTSLRQQLETMLVEKPKRRIDLDALEDE